MTTPTAEELIAAMRQAFPHFQDGADVTPATILDIGREYEKLICDPGPSEITFADQDGQTRRIVFEASDHDVGIGSGWTVPENADWVVVALPPAHDEGHPHLISGEFQSDKYPTTPRGKVPLSVKDPRAQMFLWDFAQVHRPIDAAFSDDLEIALKNAGFSPVMKMPAWDTKTNTPQGEIEIPLAVMIGADRVAAWMNAQPGDVRLSGLKLARSKALEKALDS